MSEPPWRVLLLGGPSGVGKSVAASELGRRLGIPWLEIDDLRLALQRLHARLPQRVDALYFFNETPAVWRLPPERLCNGLIAIGELLAPGVEVIIENHVESAGPIIIEGDGLLPDIVSRPMLRPFFTSRQARTAFIVESSEDALLANMMERARGLENTSAEDLRAEARAKWLFTQWIERQAQQRQLPLVASRPWATLVDRILAVSVS